MSLGGMKVGTTRWEEKMASHSWKMTLRRGCRDLYTEAFLHFPLSYISLLTLIYAHKDSISSSKCCCRPKFPKMWSLTMCSGWYLGGLIGRIWQKWDIILSIIYRYIWTEEVGPWSSRLPCCTLIFLQQTWTDIPNNDSRGGLLCFLQVRLRR